MARAGASLVQIYTSFGYRGVGAPRLVKDEVSAALPGAATWKSEIGRDYAGANMGWDEKRVAAESAALAAEAQSLGALLADLKEREDAAAMAEQANAAMAEIKAAGEHAKAAAKANAADAATAAQNAATGLIAAVAAVEPAPVAPRPLIEAAPAPLPTPAAPVVALDVRPAPSPEQQKWIQSAQGGDRRMV
jgi:dihydroorotate dehydrogenase